MPRLALQIATDFVVSTLGRPSRSMQKRRTPNSLFLEQQREKEERERGGGRGGRGREGRYRECRRGLPVVHSSGQCKLGFRCLQNGIQPSLQNKTNK